jgi:hypothetical protein
MTDGLSTWMAFGASLGPVDGHLDLGTTQIRKGPRWKGGDSAHNACSS